MEVALTSPSLPQWPPLPLRDAGVRLAFLVHIWHLWFKSYFLWLWLERIMMESEASVTCWYARVHMEVPQCFPAQSMSIACPTCRLHAGEVSSSIYSFSKKILLRLRVISIDTISLKPLFTQLVQVSLKDNCRGVDEGCLKWISERIEGLIIQFYEMWNRAAETWTRSCLVTCSITCPPYKDILHPWKGYSNCVLRNIPECSYFSWVLFSYRASSWRACILIVFCSYF